MVTINRNRREHERQGKTRKVRDLKKRRSRSTWSRKMTWDRQGNLDFNRHERWKKEKRFTGPTIRVSDHINVRSLSLADIQQDIHKLIQGVNDQPPQAEPVYSTITPRINYNSISPEDIEEFAKWERANTKPKSILDDPHARFSHVDPEDFDYDPHSRFKFRNEK